ncbi:glycosyltransferase family 32 protein [Chryseobacterium sp. RR2-3-20]|uniref:glycosyltransferase family 32 protein n=1 Tax=Chryseobacterium sp. RR2-3-20 TaxID=2787626 RepID=UPI001ADED06D|nr:glycosyltransferase [Chryseobacterium sp. RR2-3-20]
MIPKIIHYCWFGGKELPDLAKKCIESWKKHLPEYEIKEWNESNFDLDLYPFTRQAYDSKKFAYVTDVVRLYVLKKEGGVYLDSDVEMLKPLDDFLHHAAFSGFEDNNVVPTGIMASEKNSIWATEMLSYYDGKSFLDANGNPILETNVVVITNLMKDKGFVMDNTFQEISNYIAFYPSDVFCPKSHATGELLLTKKSVCIHHFAGSWLPIDIKFRKKLAGFFRKTIGNKLYNKLRGYE